jgi:hypothetical protein
MTTSGASPALSGYSTTSIGKTIHSGVSMSSRSTARAVMASRIPDAPIDLTNKFTIHLTADNYLY